MKTYLLTDTHFFHKRITTEFGRPADYDRKIIKSLEMLQPDDVLIHLGDICIGHDEAATTILTQNQIITILVRGNHDKKSNSWYMERGISLVVEEMIIKYNGKKILLSHRPMPHREDVDFNLHGHSHGNAHRDEEFCPFYEPETYHLEYALEKDGYGVKEISYFLNRKKK